MNPGTEGSNPPTGQSAAVKLGRRGVGRLVAGAEAPALAEHAAVRARWYNDAVEAGTARPVAGGESGGG